MLRQTDTHLARQDAILARQDETSRQMDTHMARLVDVMVICHHEAATAH